MDHPISGASASPGGHAGQPGPLSLRRNVSWALLGNAVYAVCQWGMLTVLARLTDPERVGQFALALAVTAPVVLLLNLKLRAVQATDINDEYGFGIYLALRLVTVPVVLAIVGGIVWFRFDGALGAVILLMGVAKTIESVSDVLFGALQKHERMDVIARSQMMKGIASLVGFALAVWLTSSLLSGVVVVALVWGCVLIFHDVPNAARVLIQQHHDARADARSVLDVLRPDWSPVRIQRLARQALPLGLTVMLGSLTTGVPQYVLQHYRGISDVGVYAAMSYPLVAGSLIIGAIGQSATPRLARRYASRDLWGFNRLVWRLVGIGMLIGAAGVLVVLSFGRQLLTLLYGEEYANETRVFLLIMTAAGVGYGYVFLGTALSAMRRFDVQLPVTLTGAGILACLCLVLVQPYGLLGIGYALVIAQLSQLALYALLLFPAVKAGR